MAGLVAADIELLSIATRELYEMESKKINPHNASSPRIWKKLFRARSKVTRLRIGRAFGSALQSYIFGEPVFTVDLKAQADKMLKAIKESCDG
jgi:hypothetical protein